MSRSVFPTSIESLKGVVMKAVFGQKQGEFENLAEALEAMALDLELRPNRMSYVITKYNEAYHEYSAQRCQYKEGFFIVQARISMDIWDPERVKTGSILITPDALSAMGS